MLKGQGWEEPWHLMRHISWQVPFTHNVLDYSDDSSPSSNKTSWNFQRNLEDLWPHSRDENWRQGPILVNIFQVIGAIAMRMSSTFSFQEIRTLIYLLHIINLNACFSVTAIVLWTRDYERHKWAHQHIDRIRTNEEMEGTNECWSPTFKPCTPYFYPHPHGWSWKQLSGRR